MNCRDTIEFLMDYLDGELPEHVHMCFDMHLQVCPQCSEYLKTYSETIRLAKHCCSQAKSLTCDKMPEDLVQAIMVARRQG